MSEYIGTDLDSMSFATNYSKWIIELCEPYIGNIVAEVGAGTGNITKLLLENKNLVKLVAFEPSRSMFNIIDAELNKNQNILTINNSLANEVNNFNNYFDSILYINVLEHIEDDASELAYIKSSLKKNGYACIFVPALSWLYSEFDISIGHHRRYHKDQLISLFESGGFNPITVKYVDLIGIVPWYIVFVLLKKKLTGSHAHIYDTMAIPVIKNMEKIVSPPIGKIFY